MRILTIAIVLLLASPASAATDYDPLLKKTKKYMKTLSSEVTSKEKGLCVCQDSSVYHAAIGTMAPDRVLGSDVYYKLGGNRER